MHEQAARALGLRYHYHLIEVAGAGREDLPLLLDGVRRLGFADAETLVSTTRKQSSICLTELSPGAVAIGRGQPRRGPQSAAGRCRDYSDTNGFYQRFASDERVKGSRAR